MRLGLLWIFILLFAEIWSIIKMSEHIGGWATLVLLVAGVFFGLQLLRAQGINAMIKAHQAAQSAQSPLGQIAQGIVKAFAGILLIIPGFFSDVIALVILLPFVRKGFAAYLAKKGQFKGFASGSFSQGMGGVFGSGTTGGFGRPSANDDFAKGNVYEHDDNAKVNTAPDRALKGDVADVEIVEAEIIELKPDNNPKDSA